MTRSLRARVPSGLAVFATAAGLAACGGWDAGEGLGTRSCASAPGSATDVEAEPAIMREGDYKRWHDRDGCKVRLDVLTDFQGLGHCDWESVQFLETGVRLGEPVVRSGPGDRRQFVRDPEAKLSQGSSERASLPANAVDTGFRRGRWELWQAPEDAAVYLVSGADVERWPEIAPTGCD